MVKKMNKHGFIDELVKQTGYDREKCIIISDSLEDNFLFGKNNKNKTINTLMTNLNCDEEEANHIYDITHSIIVKKGIQCYMSHRIPSMVNPLL